MLRLGMIGCGGISNAHATAAANSDRDLGIVACCDLNAERLARWSERHGVEATYTDLAGMLADEQLAGVIVATWPTLHREHVERCLAAGVRNILCEKALTTSAADAVALWEQANSAGAFLMEAFMYRHHPAIARMEAVLADGRLGPVDRVRGVFDIFDREKADPDDTNRNWRQQKDLGGGVEHDLACYCVNAANHFNPGRPVRVQAVGGISPKYGTLHRLYALIEYDSGCVGIIESANTADTAQELEVICAHGKLRLPIAWSIYEDVEITELRSTGWVKFDSDRHKIPAANAYRRQLENFADVIAGEAAPGMPLAETVADAFTTEAMVTSAMEERPVEIDLPDFLRRQLRSTWHPDGPAGEQ